MKKENRVQMLYLTALGNHCKFGISTSPRHRMASLWFPGDVSLDRKRDCIKGVWWCGLTQAADAEREVKRLLSKRGMGRSEYVEADPKVLLELIHQALASIDAKPEPMPREIWNTPWKLRAFKTMMLDIAK